MDELKKIEELVHAVNDRFVQLRESEGPRGNPFLVKYPAASCLIASEVAGVVLYESGLQRIALVYNRVDRRGTSHAWLENEGTVIDLTIRQFRGKSKSALILPDASWHNKRFNQRGSRSDGAELWERKRRVREQELKLIGM